MMISELVSGKKEQIIAGTFQPELVTDTRYFLYPFGKHGVHIGFSESRLRDDFVNEALIQGCGQTDADYLQKQILFQYDSAGPEFKYHLGYMDPYIIKPRVVVGLQLGTLVAAYIDRANQHPRSRADKVVGEEIAQIILPHALDAVWRHERQHVIQRIQPDFLQATQQPYTFKTRLRTLFDYMIRGVIDEKTMPKRFRAQLDADRHGSPDEDFLTMRPNTPFEVFFET